MQKSEMQGAGGSGIFFRVDEVGEVTHHGGGNHVNFAKHKLKKGRKTNLGVFIKVREITQLISRRKIRKGFVTFLSRSYQQRVVL